VPKVDAIDNFPKECAAIGRITIAWSHVELDMNFLFAAIVGVRVETAITMFETLRANRSRQEMINGCAKKLLRPELAHEIEKLMRRVQNCAKKRNFLNHYFIGFDVTRGVMNATQISTGKQTILTEPFLLEIDKDIMVLWNDIKAMAKTVGADRTARIPRVSAIYPAPKKPQGKPT